MAGDESASGPLHGQVVEEALRGRGRDGIGPRRLHSVDLDEQVDVLAGLERWQRASLTSTLNPHPTGDFRVWPNPL
ncbi:hypothetical protein MAH4_30520 [Sessilibacter sp. MAH4]